MSTTNMVTSNGESPRSGPTRVLIADDHEVVREGLRLSLSRAPHIRVIGEASDGAGAVSLVERRRPNVVIMDVRMPGMDGLEATKEIRDKVPETAVLVAPRHVLQRNVPPAQRAQVSAERSRRVTDEISRDDPSRAHG